MVKNYFPHFPNNYFLLFPFTFTYATYHAKKIKLIIQIFKIVFSTQSFKNIISDNMDNDINVFQPPH